jgi:acetyl esterase/lipase
MTDTPPPNAPEDLGPAAFRALLRARQGPPGETLEEARVRIDGEGLSISLPPGCTLAPLEAGGVAAEGLTPGSARDDRLLIYLHGGGYQVGSPRFVRHFAARLAEAAATPALVPAYRLAPEHPFPAAVEDAVAVYRWALDRLPPGRIAVAGNSAGAGLAAALALAAKAEGLPQPAGIYLVSPWADMAEGGPSYAAKAESDIYVTPEALRQGAAVYLAGADPKDPRASPLFGDFAALAPLLIHVGSEEVLLSDSVSLAERAALAEVAVRLEVFPAMLHDFPLFHPHLAAGRRAIREAGAWLAERLQ